MHIHFHNGTMEGDCSEASIQVAFCNIPTSFEEALALLNSKEGFRQNWERELIKGNDVSNDDFDEYCEYNEEFVGAWIIDDETQAKFEMSRDYMEDPGNDSDAYAQQELWKGLYRAFSIKNLGKDAT